MKIICATSNNFDFERHKGDLDVVVFSNASNPSAGSVGQHIRDSLRRKKIVPNERAWDLLVIALAIIAADLAGHRKKSPDGWTRTFELLVTVNDDVFWSAQSRVIERMLAFLTTDIWCVTLLPGTSEPSAVKKPVTHNEDCVTLLSGGVDSLVGAIDLVTAGAQPLAVSQLTQGEAKNQNRFAEAILAGLSHVQLNHNAKLPDPESPPSQRARSFLFLAYGVAAATALARYVAGERITLYVCENGFISLNPPLTGARIGSLSTRTTHPTFLAMFQGLLDAADLNVELRNPYQFKTKGEMLRECANQDVLRRFAFDAVSCGRYKRFGYRHCGRCLPCLIRRAAFHAWSGDDQTQYVYSNLSKDDLAQARFDDVRAAAMAIIESDGMGIERWAGSSLDSRYIKEVSAALDVIARGLGELRPMLSSYRLI